MGAHSNTDNEKKKGQTTHRTECAVRCKEKEGRGRGKREARGVDGGQAKGTRTGKKKLKFDSQACQVVRQSQVVDDVVWSINQGGAQKRESAFDK